MSYPQPLVALDQVINTWVYVPGDGFGRADETVSARLFRCHLQGLLPAWPYQLVDAVFFWDDAHCHAAWRGEFARADLPSHYREALPCGGR